MILKSVCKELREAKANSYNIIAIQVEPKLRNFLDMSLWGIEDIVSYEVQFRVKDEVQERLRKFNET